MHQQTAGNQIQAKAGKPEMASRERERSITRGPYELLLNSSGCNTRRIRRGLPHGSTPLPVADDLEMSRMLFVQDRTACYRRAPPSVHHRNTSQECSNRKLESSVVNQSGSNRIPATIAR